MPETDQRRLCRDPHLPWAGPFPYDQLDAFLKGVGQPGVGPNSAAAAVNDALYDIQDADEPDPAVEQAWHELHSLDRRLFLDFCLYQLPAVEEAEEEAPAEDLPVPLARLRQLAAAPPVPAQGLAGGFDPGPEPAPVPLGGDRLEVPAPDIGPVSWERQEIPGGQ